MTGFVMFERCAFKERWAKIIFFKKIICDVWTMCFFLWPVNQKKILKTNYVSEHFYNCGI